MLSPVSRLRATGPAYGARRRLRSRWFSHRCNEGWLSVLASSGPCYLNVGAGGKGGKGAFDGFPCAAALVGRNMGRHFGDGDDGVVAREVCKRPKVHNCILLAAEHFPLVPGEVESGVWPGLSRGFYFDQEGVSAVRS